MSEIDVNILIEQYKMFVESANKVSERRGQTNAFYISVLTALLVILSLIIEKNTFSDQTHLVFFSIGLLGCFLCIVWGLNIQSYKQLNSAKFKVIHDMESNLPYACFDKEWEYLGRGKDSKKYLKLSIIEKFVPLILSAPYVFLIYYSTCHFFW